MPHIHHGLRRAELCGLHLVELQERRSVRRLRELGKRKKIRYLPLHSAAAGAIAVHLQGRRSIGYATMLPMERLC